MAFVRLNDEDLGNSQYNGEGPYYFNTYDWSQETIIIGGGIYDVGKLSNTNWTYAYDWGWPVPQIDGTNLIPQFTILRDIGNRFPNTSVSIDFELADAGSGYSNFGISLTTGDTMCFTFSIEATPGNDSITIGMPTFADEDKYIILPYAWDLTVLGPVTSYPFYGSIALRSDRGFDFHCEYGTVVGPTGMPESPRTLQASGSGAGLKFGYIRMMEPS